MIARHMPTRTVEQVRERVASMFRPRPRVGRMSAAELEQLKALAAVHGETLEGSGARADARGAQGLSGA